MHWIILVGVGGMILAAIIFSGFGLVGGGAYKGMAKTSASYIGGTLASDVSFALSVDEPVKLEEKLPKHNCSVHFHETYVRVQSEVKDLRKNGTFFYLSEAENLDKKLKCDPAQEKKFWIKKEGGEVYVEE